MASESVWQCMVSVVRDGVALLLEELLDDVVAWSSRLGAFLWW